MQKLTSTVFYLLPMAPQLRTLSIKNIKMPENTLIQIAKNCPLLEELTLRGCLKDTSAENGLHSIFTCCSNLKYLDISQNYLDGTFSEYLPSQLLYLNLGDIHSSEALFNVSEKAKNLETLILRYFDRDNINDWLRKMTKLRFLSFKLTKAFRPLDLSNLKDLEVVNLQLDDVSTMNTLESLQNCPKLRALEVSSCFAPIRDFNDYIQMFKRFKSLKHLSLPGFKNWDGLVGFVQSSQLKVSFFEINTYLYIESYSFFQTLSVCFGLDEFLEILKNLIRECVVSLFPQK